MARFSTRTRSLLASVNAVLAAPFVQALVVFAVLAAPALRFEDADPDLFARVAVGRLFVLMGGLPQQDPFAYTPKNPAWYDHEWLSGVLFYALSQFGGDWALFVFKFVCWFLTIWFVARAMSLLCRGPLFRLWWLLLTCLWCGYIWGYTVRSQVFTYLLFGWLLLACASVLSRGSARPLYPAPLAMTAWANLHGGFVAGLGILMLFCAGLALQKHPARRTAAAIFVLSCAATLINPYGLHYLVFVGKAVTMARPGIEEWRSLTPDSLLGAGLWVYAALILAGWLFNRRSCAAAPMLALIAANLYGWKHARLLGLFMMSAAVFGAAPVSELFRRVPGTIKHYLVPAARVVTVWLVALQFPLGLAAFAGIIGHRQSFTLHYHNYPVSALEWLYRTKPGGRLLVEYKYGSYALWRLYPRFLVSMDGRYEEVYPQRTVDLVRAAYDPALPLHGEALKELEPDYILGDAEHEARYDFGPGWHLLYRDEKHLIYGRQAAPTAMGKADNVVPDWQPRF